MDGEGTLAAEFSVSSPASDQTDPKKREKKLHLQYYSPNRITADEVKCKYTVCLCK